MVNWTSESSVDKISLTPFDIILRDIILKGRAGPMILEALTKGQKNALNPRNKEQTKNLKGFEPNQARSIEGFLFQTKALFHSSVY